MQKLTNTLLTLDAANDLDGINALLTKDLYSSDQLIYALQLLFNQYNKHNFLRPAYMVALHLDKVGCQHPCISLLLALVGLLLGNPEMEKRGFAMLRMQINAISQPKQQSFGDQFGPTLRGIVNKLLILESPKDHGKILRLIDILKLVIPQFRTMFDWDAPIPNLSIDEMRQRGQAVACLVKVPLPPADAPRVRRRVLVMFSRNYPFGIGFRFKDAMNTYGWQAEMCEGVYNTVAGEPWYKFLQDVNASADCRAIVEECRQKKIDLLYFELAPFILFKSGFDAYKEMKSQLLRDNPSIKIFGMLGDAYVNLSSDILELMDALFDGILSALPLAFHIQASPGFERLTKKFLHYSNTVAGDQNMGTPDRPLTPQITYRGSLDTNHWIRAIWLYLVTHRLGLPITVEANKFSFDDTMFKNAPSENHAIYMRSVAEATCSLSMSTVNRSEVIHGFSRLLNSRGFEAPLSGALLVQEFTPMMHYFFIPGEHYLEFSTVAELSNIMRFITEHREEAEEVRRRGNAFAKEHYSDVAIIGRIDKFLYFPE